MKAILILDMPISCIDCPFTLAHICDGGKQTISDIKGRHESCPLKPMPKEKDGTFRWVGIAEADESYIHGWNDCLKELKK